MREIKFRAWSILDKKMLGWGQIFDLPAWEIFPGTPEQRAFEVMQFTGLLDKNGKEIYEGDVITNFGVENNMKLRKYEVKWNDEGARFFLEYKKAKDSTSFDKWSMRNCEIIGNRFENPDLIP